MNVWTGEIKRNPASRGFPRKGGTIDKRFLHCEHCKKNGHTRDTCFKLNGFPEWFKNLTEQKRRNNRTPNLKALNAEVERDIEDFAGMTLISTSDLDKYTELWIIDSRASAHICTKAVNVIFTYKSCIVQDHQIDKVIARGKQQGKLYVVSGDILQNKNKDSDLANTTRESLDSENSFVYKDRKLGNSNLWHCRLGHAGIDVMNVYTFVTMNRLIN
ncbi:UNVERIFIED_CONTAM: hypothetical protein Sindi_0938300 [Sesamum indicum]